MKLELGKHTIFHYVKGVVHGLLQSCLSSSYILALYDYLIAFEKVKNHKCLCIYEYVPITLSLLPLFPFNPFCIMFHGHVLLVVIACAIHLDFKYIFIYICTRRHTTNNLQ